MLTLTRKDGERIYLRCPDGTLIVVMPSDIDRNRVRINIDAPRGVDIWREEVAPAAILEQAAKGRDE